MLILNQPTPADIALVGGRWRSFTIFRLSTCLTLGLWAIVAARPNESFAQNWLRFRGPQGSGVSSESQKIPSHFSDEKNLLWKTKLPGCGASSPIIVGDKSFVTCYSGYGENRTHPGEMKDLHRHVICFRKTDGVKLWQKNFHPVLPEDPFTGVGISEHGYASSTPVSDGKSVFVFFGKSGVVALDLDGNEQWSASLGTGTGEKQWGSAASPVISAGVLIVNASDEDESLIGLDLSSGRQLWKVNGIKNYWGTPVIARNGPASTVIVTPPNKIQAFDAATGNLRWFSNNGVLDSNVSASPVLYQDSVILMGGRSRTAVAVRIDGADGADVTDSKTIWEGTSSGRITTPIVYQDYIYYFSKGIAYCQHAQTGNYVFEERLPRPHQREGQRSSNASFSSPVIADEKIFFVTRGGTCHVLAAKPEFKMLATNHFELDESEFNATPAISENCIFIRSNQYLYCVGLR